MRLTRAMRAALALALALSVTAAVVGVRAGHTHASRATADVGAPLTFQPQLGAPARAVQLIGASPGEGGGEVWGEGTVGSVPASTAGGGSIAGASVLVRRTTASSAWDVVPVADASGARIPFSWTTQSVSAGGGIALVGSAPTVTGDATQRTVVTRTPGGAFATAPVPTSSGSDPVLAPGETLPGASGQTVAAVDDGGQTDAFVATAGSARAGVASASLPVCAPAAPGGGTTTTPTTTGVTTTPTTTGTTTTPTTTSTTTTPTTTTGAAPAPPATAPVAVLRYDGSSWTREPICDTASSGALQDPVAGTTVLAVAASSPGNAWLLAQPGGAAAPAVLYQRTTQTDGSVVWVEQHPATWLLGSGTVPGGGVPQVHPTLTVTSQGVWVDASAGATDATTLIAASADHSVLGLWCHPQANCAGAGSLGGALPANETSSAWPTTGGGVGTRIIGGLPNGALLRLTESGDFSYTVGAGGAAASSAAFVSPAEGWLGVGGEQLIHVTTAPTPQALSTWSVPFRRPLLAIATAPGTTVGAAGAQALAVGDQGAIARYAPGQGWRPEYLYSSSGVRQTPRLRGVAWPETGRAYAVGDSGAMWVWRSATNLWEPDPAAPFNFHANLTAIAFQPGNPARGYAVGKQGTLLSYDKTWTPQAPPAGLEQANFTSVAFAGSEAIVSYRMPDPANPHGSELGGAIVNDGSGWRVDTGVAALLATLANAPSWETDARVLSRAAGLPDGGAALAGPHVVLERDSSTSPWRFASEPLPTAANIDALAAVRDGASVRALVSIDVNSDSAPSGAIYTAIDDPPASPIPNVPVLIAPDPLPVTGYLLRETASGWSDMQGDDYPQETAGAGQASDLPDWPDPVLALAVDADGTQGWAVGGQTGGLVAKSPLTNVVAASQTASVERFGAGADPPQEASAPIVPPAGTVSFAVGGNAQCASTCAELANQGIGPDQWLSAAVSRAGQVGGLHAFLYTGSRLAAGMTLDADAQARELSRYATVLRADGRLPAYATASASDAGAMGTGAFTSALGGEAPAGAVPAGTPAPPSGSAAYAFDSPGVGGTVRVIVLDYSASSLGGVAPSGTNCASGSGQAGWLCSQLEDARAAAIPAIVIGSRDVTGSDDDAASDGSATRAELVANGASAYFFDSPEENVSRTLSSGGARIPAFGTGTLGYTSIPPNPADFLGASGFLIASVNVGARVAATNVAPVTVSLIPNIGELGLDATNGLLLRRSQVALFQGLARRPSGGSRLAASAQEQDPDPYVPVPQTCQGSDCGQFIEPQYTFSSSNPDIGNFVKHDDSSTNVRAVLQDASGKPIPDPTSGIFCAFNAGTTTVTLQAGGLSYSEVVTVQGGSVLQPCGTVPLVNPPTVTTPSVAATVAVPDVSPTVNPTVNVSPKVTFNAPPPPPAATPVAKPAPKAKPAKKAKREAVPSILAAAPLVPAFILGQKPGVIGARGAPTVPPPPAGQPTPPSGTSQVSSQVSQSVGAPEEKREEEIATESADTRMSAYYPEEHGHGHGIPPWSPVALVLVAALAGAGIKRRGGGGTGTARKAAFARASTGERRRR